MREHKWEEGEIFVFGSNLKGIHGAGAALFARMHCGAILGQGEGLQGSSFALPTCTGPGAPLTIDEIHSYVLRFLFHVDDHPEQKYFLTAVGTGIAGFSHEEIAESFDMMPLNVRMPPEWDRYFRINGGYYRFSLNWTN